jgi:transcriptional regulator with XRE-family HTH domain
MNRKKDYEDSVERNQIKNALINCAKTHGMSLSEFASEAGVSPSTLTGFVNDISTRAEHILSMRTISKLTKAFPDLSSFMQLAEPTPELQEVRFIGLVDIKNNWQIVGLDPQSPGSTMIQNQKNDYVAFGVKSINPIFDARVYFCNSNIIENIDEINKYIFKLLIVDCAEGRYMGYLMSGKNNHLYLGTIPSFENSKHEVLTEITDINWFMPVEWIRP